MNLFWDSALIRNDVVGVISRFYSGVMSVIDVQEISTLLNVVTAAKERVHFLECYPLSLRNAASIISTLCSPRRIADHLQEPHKCREAEVDPGKEVERVKVVMR